MANKKEEKPKVHYVCTGGCGFVSDKPGNCPTVGCYRYRNPLTECHCTDGKHNGLLEKNVPDDMKGKDLPFRIKST